MPRPHRSASRQIRWAGAVALAAGLGSAGLAGNGLQWRLEARVPVMCAILAVDTAAGPPAGLAIATSCNAERYRLRLRQGTGPAGLRSARSSAGPVEITGGTVTITSSQPGHAVTVVELTEPVSPRQVAVTLEPL